MGQYAQLLHDLQKETESNRVLREDFRTAEQIIYELRGEIDGLRAKYSVLCGSTVDFVCSDSEQKLRAAAAEAENLRGQKALLQGEIAALRSAIVISRSDVERAGADYRATVDMLHSPEGRRFDAITAPVGVCLARALHRQLDAAKVDRAELEQLREFKAKFSALVEEAAR